MRNENMWADVLNFILVIAGLVAFAVINFFINGGPELVDALTNNL